MCSSIQASAGSSSSTEKAIAPRTPMPPALLTSTTTSLHRVNAKMGYWMPKVSQRRVRIAALAPLRRKAHGHVLDAVDEVGAQARDGAGRLDVGQAAQELLEHHVDLEAGEAGAEAEVRPAAAEGEMRVRVARGVEAFGVREHVLLAL